MKKYIVIHNLNSRGKNLSKEFIEMLLNAEDLNYEYFPTKTTVSYTHLTLPTNREV